MENTPIVNEVVAPKKNVLFEVTTLSKVLAAILFIILPFVGFWLGTQYNVIEKPEEITTIVQNETVLNDVNPQLAIPILASYVSEKSGLQGSLALTAGGLQYSTNPECDYDQMRTSFEIQLNDGTVLPADGKGQVYSDKVNAREAFPIKYFNEGILIAELTLQENR